MTEDLRVRGERGDDLCVCGRPRGEGVTGHGMIIEGFTRVCDGYKPADKENSDGTSMSLSLTPTRVVHVYEEGDDDCSGYRYRIEVVHTHQLLPRHPERREREREDRGWDATVQFQTWGATTPEAAIRHLEPALKHLLADIEGAREP